MENNLYNDLLKTFIYINNIQNINCVMINLYLQTYIKYKIIFISMSNMYIIADNILRFLVSDFFFA